MKLMKFIPAFTAALVLSACSTGADTVSSTANAVSKTAEAVAEGVSQVATQAKEGVSGAAKAVAEKFDTSTKSVVYHCQNNTLVTAAYTFSGEKATSVRLTLGKKVIKDLMVDEKAPNPVTFASKTHRWHADESFSLATFDQSESVMLFKLGQGSDDILAKNCRIDKTATAKMNK